jgi:hypothetical protein
MQRTKVNRNFWDTCDSDLAFFLPIDFGDPGAERLSRTRVSDKLLRRWTWQRKGYRPNPGVYRSGCKDSAGLAQ